MIKSFLIISKEGYPLFMKSDDTNTIDNTMVSCFLSAIQSFAEKVGKSKIDKIEMQTNTFYYAVNGPIFSIVVADPNDEIDNRIYKITAERISRAFLQKYPEHSIEEKKDTPDYFEDFKKEYLVISSEISQIKDQGHRDFILDYFTRAASDENIVGIIVFDLKKDEIIASDVPDYITAKNFESFSSMLFNFIDRMGKELKAGEINEILMRAEEHWIGGFRKGDLAVFVLFTHEYFGNIIPDFITSAIK